MRLRREIDDGDIPTGFGNGKSERKSNASSSSSDDNRATLQGEQVEDGPPEKLVRIGFQELLRLNQSADHVDGVRIWP
jgi:hypothetical protein